MNISSALKHKNRQASELKTKEAIFIRENSRKTTSTSNVDALKVFDEIVTLKQKLAKTKAAISIASGPIQYKILYIGELRGLINTLKTVDKTDGEQVTPSYSREPVKEMYTAAIKAEDADARITNLQKEIDELQDQIDTHNAKTEIVIE